MSLGQVSYSACITWTYALLFPLKSFFSRLPAKRCFLGLKSSQPPLPVCGSYSLGDLFLFEALSWSWFPLASPIFVLLTTSLSFSLVFLLPWSLDSPFSLSGLSCLLCGCSYHLDMNNFPHQLCVGGSPCVIAPFRLRVSHAALIGSKYVGFRTKPPWAWATLSTWQLMDLE